MSPVKARLCFGQSRPSLAAEAVSIQKMGQRMGQRMGGQRMTNHYRDLPLSFEAAGEDSRFDFLSRGAGGMVALSGAEAELRLPSSALKMKPTSANPHPGRRGFRRKPVGNTTTANSLPFSARKIISHEFERCWRIFLPPVESAENNPGLVGLMRTFSDETFPSPPVILISASPNGMTAGIKQFTCEGLTKKSGASRSMPALSMILTVVPCSEVGRGSVWAAAVPVANGKPKAEAIASRANSSPLKLAAETMLAGGL